MITAVAPKRPTAKWTPPLDADGLRLVLERFRAWTLLDIEDLFDDLDTAIGNQPPSVATPAALVDHVRSHLMQLLDITEAGDSFPPTADIAQLVGRARARPDECTPTAHEQAVGLARRLAFVTAGLIEELIEARDIKGTE